MTTQFDFTNNEWSDIAVLPVLVGLAVARAEDSGTVGSYFEIRTLVTSIAAEPDDSPAKALIEAISTIDVKEKIEELEANDPEVLADVAARSCREIAKLIEERASDGEARAYKLWVHGIGRRVAEAAREDGVRVSPTEIDLLRRLRTELSL
jgi:ribosomal protein L12E/L44/L45/RPP1/RPP2